MTRILLVGYGRMARQSHIRQIEAFDQAKLVGIVRRSEDSSGAIPQFNKLFQALDKLRPDVAIISTPHALHYEQALACLQAGCHVLVDKPLTLKLHHSRHLVEVAEENGRLLVVGVQRRYEGLASIFGCLVRENRLGKPILIHGLFAHRFADEQPAWISDKSMAGAGIVDDSGWHLVDLLLFLSGSHLAEVNAKVQCEPNNSPHSFNLIATCENGIGISATASYLAPRDSVQEEISIYGSSGTLFGRRFCLEWNTNPPDVSFKTFDGTYHERFDMSPFPSGRHLPLQALLNYLSGRGERSQIRSEAKEVLETQRVIEMVRDSVRKF